MSAAGDRVNIKSEGLSPICGVCRIQVAQPGSRHKHTRTCVGLAAQLQQHTTAATAAEALNKRFTAYGMELATVGFFKYLGRLLAGDDNNIQAVRAQLMKARGT